MSDSTEDNIYGMSVDDTQLSEEEILYEEQIQSQDVADDSSVYKSKIGFPDMWGRPPASSVRSAQTYQDIFGKDPYQGAKSLISEDLSIYDAYYRSNQESDANKTEILVNRVSGVSDFFGTVLYRNAEQTRSLGIYNRTVDQSRNIIPKSNFDTKRLGSKAPQGFKSRATDVDYSAWFESNLSRTDIKGFKGSFYQFGESNVVQTIMSSDKKVEITSQGYAYRTPLKDKGEDFFRGQQDALKIAMDSEVTRKAFSKSQNKFVYAATLEEGAYHPKLGYFYDAKDNVVSAVFGTQNITTALSKNNTIEEVLFLTNDKGSAKASRVLYEIKTVTDILQSVSTSPAVDKSKTLRERIDTEITDRFKPSNEAQYITVNKKVTEKAVSILENLAADKTKNKAVVSIQYLENLFIDNEDSSDSFGKHRTKALTSLEQLITQGRVAIALSDVSFSSEQGLFYLIDKMRDKEKQGSSLTAIEQQALKVFKLAEKNQAFRSINTQFMHSKSITILNEQNELVSYFISSANWGKQSFNKNIETGLHLTGADLFEDLGINAQHISKYNTGIWNNRSTGLYVEQKGVESQVQRTVTQLDSILSEAKKGGLDAPFRYNQRYINENGKFKAVGLDIVLQDKMTLSVTIGESKIGTYDKATGKTIIKEIPIVYLNKGNRVITGAMWTNKSSSLVTLPGGRQVETGQTISLDAVDVLQGILYTLHHSSKVEREQRVLLQSLERLNNTSDKALATAVDRYFSGNIEYKKFSAEAKQSFVEEKLRFLQNIINTKDYRQVIEHNSLIRELIRTNQAAEAYYGKDLRQSKSNLLSSLIDIFAKPHELSYSYTQKLYDKASYGIADTNLNMLFPDRDRNSNTVNLVAPLLGQIASEHNDLIYLNGMPAIRGVGATNRLESTKPADLMGGLGKAEGGTLTVKDLDIMNSIPGLMLLSAKEYRTKIGLFIHNDSEIESFVKLVFSEAASKLGDGEKVKDDEVLLYFPYQKPEQISQRLKNLMSVRPFVGSSKSFTSYVKSLGFNKYDQEDVVGSKVATAMPAVQYEVFKEQYEKNRLADPSLSGKQLWDITEKQMQKRALDLDDVMHGFVESPKLFFLSSGGSSMSDFSDINMTLANETGYVFTHRSQTPIDLDTLGLSPVEFQSILQSKLKAGTMFVPLKTRIKNEGQTKELFDFLNDRWLTAVDEARLTLTANGTTQPTEIDVFRKAQQDLKHLAKTNPEQYDFALSFDFIRNGVFDPYLKKGVFNPVYDDSGNFKSLERIGDIPEGSSAYHIYGLTKSQKAGTATKASGYFDWTNPSQGRRLADGSVSVIARTPQISIVDRQPSMITLNTEYYTWQGLSTGMRTTTIKGPMLGKERSYFQAVQDMHNAEHQNDFDAKSYITQEELFGISAPGQMKGFVFSTGYALLREGHKSEYYTATNDSNRIVEALSLMMLSNKSEGISIKDRLLQFYNTETSIQNRTQFKELLSSRDLKNKLTLTEPDNLGKQVSSIALYEGLIGLIAPEHRQLGEEGLVRTVAEALSNTDKRTKLASRARDLFNKFFLNEEYSFSKGGNRTFNEQKGRSAALLAFYMKAAESLLGDVSQNRFSQKSISEIGYVSRAQAKDIISSSVESYKGFALRQEEQVIHRRLESILAYSDNKTRDIQESLNTLPGDSILKQELTKLLNETPGAVSSYEAYLNRARDREMYRAHAQSMAISLPSIKDINEAQGTARDNLLEQLELGLHQMYSVSQAVRFMPIYVDPKANKNAPAVGMQNKTDLEGHYAQRLTELQLKMYTQSATDYKAVDSVASVVLRLAGIVEADHGILHQTTLNSRYRLRDTHLVTLGSYQDLTIKEALKHEINKVVVKPTKPLPGETPAERRIRRTEYTTKAKESREKIKVIQKTVLSEAASAHAMRFSLDFARAYSNISAKVPVNLLGGRTTINGRTTTVQGEVQAAPAFAAIHSFIKTTSRATWNSADFDNHLGYMTHVTALARRASSDYSGEHELVERRNAMLDDYMHFISSPNSSLGRQARNLVQTLLEPLESLARTLSGDNFKGTLNYDAKLNRVVYTEPHNLFPWTTGKKETYTFNVDNQADINLIEANPNHVYSIDLDRRRGIYQELLVKRFIGEKVNKADVEQFIKDPSRIGDAKVRELVKSLYTEAPAAEKALLQSIIGKKIDDVIQANLMIDPGKEYVQGRQALRDYSKAIVSSHGYTYDNTTVANAFIRMKADVIKTQLIREAREANPTAPLNLRSIEAQALRIARAEYKRSDAILTSADTKTIYNYLNNLSSRDKKQKSLVNSFHEVYMAHKVMSTVSYTQSISIPYLEIQPEATTDGTAKVLMLPNEHTKAEKGVILSLDIMERVSLVFPQYSSAALEAQQSFAEALSIANQQGLLTKINEAVTSNKPLVFTNAEYMLYQEVLNTARQSRETSAALSENEKITRNAMGEQLPMKGASYIAVSSFLVASTEVAFGEERMSNILKLQEGGFSKMVKGYTDIIAKHTKGEPSVTEAAVKAVNEFAAFFNDGHTSINKVTDLLKQLGPEIYKNGRNGEIKKKALEQAIRNYILGGKDLNDKEAEQQLYLSHFLKGRQGAPSGTGYDFATGAQGLFLNTIHNRGALNLSSSLIDVENGSTAMILSAMGNEFTQLGDYDGDSFQAAINRLAEATAEVKKRQEEYSTALTAKNKMPDGSLENESVKAQIAKASSDFKQASEILASKTQALNELHRQATTQGKENIRKYAQAFMGLPGFVLDSDDARVDRLGVLSDEEIAPLVKQYRDTISGWYDNQKAVKGYLSEFLATKVSDINFTSGSISYKTDVDQTTTEHQRINEEIQQLVTAHKRINPTVDLAALDNKTQIEKKQEILQTAAILSQQQMSLDNLVKLDKKAMGSQLSTTNFAQVQAIIGATGTGLLGKTYNTVIPLLSISAGNSAMLHTLENNKEKLLGDLSAAIAAKRTETNLKRQDELFLQTLSETISSPGNEFHLKSSISKAQAKSNAMFGLLMNVQQFLRDAALKPKETKGDAISRDKSILDLASEYEIKGNTELEYLSKEKGLANLLNAAKSAQHRSLIMDTFITNQAGFSLDKLWDKQKQDHDTTTLRAFSALQLVNEYMSGSYSADEMFEHSAFKSYLGKIRESKPLMSNVEIVEGVIKDSLSNFRSQFIYGSVLEGENRVEQLTEPTKKLLSSFDIDFATGQEKGTNIINARVNEYQKETSKSFGVSANQLTTEQRETIKKQTDEYKEEQNRQKQIILEAVQGSTDNSTKIQNVWKAIIGINIDKQMEHLVGKDGQPGIISQVRDFNLAVQKIRDGVLPGIYDAASAELGIVTYGASLGRGKVEPLTVAEAGNYILKAALSMTEDKTNSTAMASLMAGMGISTQNLDFMQKAVDSTVETTMQEFTKTEGFTAGSKEYTDKRQQVTTELNQTAIELMVKPFTVNDKTTSFAQETNKASVTTAAIAEVQQKAQTIAAYSALNPNDSVVTSYAAHTEEVSKQTKAQSVDSLYNQLNETGFSSDPISQAIDNQHRIAYSKTMSEVRSAYVEEHIKASKRSHKVSGLIALMAIPTLFSVIQGDITFNDRVADLVSNVSQAALSTVSYKESSLYKTLYSDVDLNTERTTGEKAAARVNNTLQYARIAESLRRNSSITEGLVKGVAFEAIYSSASIVATEVSNRVFGHNTAANIASEVGGALLGMMMANAITERNVPGSFGTYDYAYDITMRMIKRVKDNILAAGSALTTQLISGSDVSDELQVYTSSSNESLTQVVTSGDASLNTDLNSMPLAVSLEYREGNGVAEQLVSDVFYQGDLESGDILISVENYNDNTG